MDRLRSGGYVGPYTALMASAQVELTRALLHNEPFDWSRVIDHGQGLLPNNEGINLF